MKILQLEDKIKRLKNRGSNFNNNRSFQQRRQSTAATDGRVICCNCQKVGYSTRFCPHIKLKMIREQQDDTVPR